MNILNFFNFNFLIPSIAVISLNEPGFEDPKKVAIAMKGFSDFQLLKESNFIRERISDFVFKNWENLSHVNVEIFLRNFSFLTLFLSMIFYWIHTAFNSQGVLFFKSASRPKEGTGSKRTPLVLVVEPPRKKRPLVLTEEKNSEPNPFLFPFYPSLAIGTGKREVCSNGSPPVFGAGASLRDKNVVEPSFGRVEPHTFLGQEPQKLSHLRTPKTVPQVAQRGAEEGIVLLEERAGGDVQSTTVKEKNQERRGAKLVENSKSTIISNCFKKNDLTMYFVAQTAMILSNFLLILLLLFRWKESGHFPLSNLYESLMFLSWSCTLIHFVLEFKTERIKFNWLPADFFTRLWFRGKATFTFGRTKQDQRDFPKKRAHSLEERRQKERLTGGFAANQRSQAQGGGFATEELFMGLVSGSSLWPLVLSSDRREEPKAKGKNSGSTAGRSTSIKKNRYKKGLIGSISSPIAFLTNAFAGFALPIEMQKASPLVPALQSNWLMMHVTVMIISYSALILGSLFSIAFLILGQDPVEKVTPSDIKKKKPFFIYPFPASPNSFFSVKNKATTLESGGPPYAPPTSLSFPSLGGLGGGGVRSRWVRTKSLLLDGVSESDLLRLKAEPTPSLSYTKITLAWNLDNLSYRILGIGFPFLTIGILSGAVWANEAWGSYWSWDPKETWALLTWLIFAIYLHARITKGWQGKKPAIIASLGFFTLWICFLGVNLLGEGLHSYGWFSHS